MKLTAIALACAGLFAAGSAAASAPVSDVDYLKANRCEGLAAAVGQDAKPFAVLVKRQSQTRADYIIQRGQEEYARAKHQGDNDQGAAKAELAGACAAYLNTASSTGAGH